MSPVTSTMHCCRVPVNELSELRQMWTNFQNCFTGRFARKFTK